METDDPDEILEELEFEPEFLDPGRLAAAEAAGDILGGQVGAAHVIALANYLLGED